MFGALCPWDLRHRSWWLATAGLWDLEGLAALTFWVVYLYNRTACDWRAYFAYMHCVLTIDGTGLRGCGGSPLRAVGNSRISEPGLAAEPRDLMYTNASTMDYMGVSEN